jgi:hypothetical protein
MTDRRRYRVLDGVTRVNGQRVTPGQEIELTEAQARYEVDQLKLEPVGSVVAPTA